MEITKIAFENYKAFKFRQELCIKPITIVIGKNSSGKSVVSRLPLLLARWLSSSAKTPLEVKFSGVTFGEGFRDLIYNRFEHGHMSLGITCGGNTTTLELEATIQTIAGRPPIQIISRFLLKSGDDFSFELNWNLQQPKDPFAPQLYHAKGNYVGDVLVEFTGLLPEKLINPKDGTTVALPKLTSLHEEIRASIDTIQYIGPFRDLPKPSYNYSKAPSVYPGYKGTTAYQMLGRDAAQIEGKIVEAVGDWYAKKLGGWKLDIVPRGEEFEVVLISPDNPDVKINLANVGSGMSQVLPLVVRMFLEHERSGGIDIFEQPELHLHPAAHGDLAELFAGAVRREQGRFIIETHSENFLLRIRRLIVNGTLDWHDVIIYWVDDEERPGSMLKPIHIDEDGELDDWPEGVFSEDYDELIAIREAQRKKRERS